MTSRKGEELLTAANPVPEPIQLASEPFSLSDVLDRLDGPVEPLDAASAPRQGLSRALAVAGVAFLAVIAIGAASILLLGSDGSPSEGGSELCEGDAGITGESTFYGSGGYNPFIGIHQSLISQSDQAVFTATVTGDESGRRVYFRLATVETYDGNHFYFCQPELATLDARPWIDPSQQWIGPTSALTVDVEIARLRMDWLPAPPTPTEWQSISQPADAVRVRRDDGALALVDGFTHAGMQYSVVAEIPQVDMRAVVADADGRLTPVFAAAAAAGEPVPAPHPEQLFRPTPPDPDRHTGLPVDQGFRRDDLKKLAESVVTGAESTFERGLALEAWLHSDAFSYSLDLEPSSPEGGISAWLLDAESPEYHTGYAEHFTTALAVLARSLDIPSRIVLGFAPGEATDGDAVTIYDRDAHAWVELWIPQHGWLAFDPTPRSSGDTTPRFESIEQQLGFDLGAYLP